MPLNVVILRIQPSGMRVDRRGPVRTVSMLHCPKSRLESSNSIRKSNSALGQWEIGICTGHWASGQSKKRKVGRKAGRKGSIHGIRERG